MEEMDKKHVSPVTVKLWQQEQLRRKAMAKSARELKTADEEFDAAFAILKKYPRRITFFGSARLLPNSTYYQKAHDLAGILADDGYAIISGGGGGIMEASDRGAYENDDAAIGFNIKLPHEQHLNSFTTEHLAFNFFFTRKVMMTFYSHAFVCFPGGFGTLDEFFEVITLMQTGKMPRVPVILVGKEFWGGLDKFIRKHMLKTGLISPGDTDLYTITENLDNIHHIFKSYENAQNLSA